MILLQNDLQLQLFTAMYKQRVITKVIKNANEW
jgi:hypothetical protein